MLVVANYIRCAVVNPRVCLSHSQTKFSTSNATDCEWRHQQKPCACTKNMCYIQWQICNFDEWSIAKQSTATVASEKANASEENITAIPSARHWKTGKKWIPTHSFFYVSNFFFSLHVAGWLLKINHMCRIRRRGLQHIVIIKSVILFLLVRWISVLNVSSSCSVYNGDDQNKKFESNSHATPTKIHLREMRPYETE